MQLHCIVEMRQSTIRLIIFTFLSHLINFVWFSKVLQLGQ